MMSLDEEIKFIQYNPAWVTMFAEEKELLLSATGNLIQEIAHHGSTAVPGLSAKPIVDVLVGIEDLDHFPSLEERLLLLDYKSCGKSGSGQYDLKKRGEQSFNLAIVRWQSDDWFRHIKFRDYLRAFPEEARRYGEYKRNIIKYGVKTLLEYNKNRHEYIFRLLEKIERWKKPEN